VDSKLPENKPCLICKHVHIMLILEYCADGSVKYMHQQCATKRCRCLEGIFNNLEYLERMSE
jgi:hypothetical protein